MLQMGVRQEVKVNAWLGPWRPRTTVIRGVRRLRPPTLYAQSLVPLSVQTYWEMRVPHLPWHAGTFRGKAQPAFQTQWA